MEAADEGRAAAAAVRVAASLGLAAEAAEVLHSSNKLALRLTPCDVLARVTRLGHDDARLELRRAQQLAAAGCPVGVVHPGVDPIAYERDGFAVTLWVYHDPAAGPVSPTAYAEALVRLHAGMRSADLAGPRFTDRIAEAQLVVASPDLSPELVRADRELVGDRLEALRRTIDERGAADQLLHGEPHPGNVRATPDGPVFIDFETLCRGPVEFDLAHVPEAVCRSYPDVDQELLDGCRQLVLAMVGAWRWQIGDEFSAGRRWGHAFVQALRDGPPWPTLDTMARRFRAS